MGRTFTPGELDLIDQIKKLQERIANLERTRQSQNSIVENGGQIIVEDGTLVVRHPNGTELFRVGQGSFIFPLEVETTQGYVTVIKRPNGTTVLELFSDEDGVSSRIQMEDRNGNVMIQEDYLIGRGLARPFIPWHAQKLSDFLTPPVTVTAGTYTSTYLITSNYQQPAVYLRMRVIADAGTSGDIRLRDTFFNVTLWETAIESGFNGYKEGIGTISTLYTYGQNITFEVQVQRTGGAGNIRVGFEMAYGQNALTL